VKGLTVKITEIESLRMFEEYHLVRVRTDQGIVGIGEIGSRHTLATETLLHKALGPMLIGRNPFDTERLWHDMLHVAYKFGPGGSLLEAIAGLDIAFWDIIGRACGQPLYQLLGGRYREKIRVYASSNRPDLSPAEEAERALVYQAEGFYGYKIHPFTRWMYDDGASESQDNTVEKVRAIREKVGDAFDILVDVTNAYTPHSALRVARQLEELNVWHFEEPIAEHDLAGYAQLAASADIAIAAGENFYTCWQFRDLIVNGQVDIIQPDVIKCGGITEFRKIAGLAEAFNRPITMHNTQPSVGTVAHMHLWASTPGCVHPQEYMIEPHPLRDEWPILKDQPAVEHGELTLTDHPGLGVEIDDDVVQRLIAAGHATLSVVSERC
jgi:L-alanine-DL-glutamate epimerase-like enolase superfamily enzyme